MDVGETILLTSDLSSFKSSYTVGAANTFFWQEPNTWTVSYPNHNKTEQAYQVIRALMRAKVIEIRTLAKFFDAMDEVLKVI